jgi:putative flippase GtrA
MSDHAHHHRAPRVHVRLRQGVTVRENWVQLLQFGLVGGTGYVVNLIVFWLVHHPLGVDYRVASIIAFLVAVANNFLINRIWTFDGHHGSMRMQALRFFGVSVTVFVVTWVLLQVLVGAGLAELVAQAISVALGTPLNFVGNKLWSFSKFARR